MPVERPTFSESWYRVAGLRPRLRSTVQISRQHFRGVMWHVLQDPSNNQFFRLNGPAYHFVALLDGRRTIAEVWDVCNDQLGDEAPTQGEAIQLLGQLYTSNLLQGEMPPDAAGLLKRHQQRRRREIQSRLTNILFIHIPLFDPDHFLNRWLSLFGKVFAWWGWILWAPLVAAGLYFVAGRWQELFKAGSDVLESSNLPLLYLAALLVKVFHEFGHAFACKRFGRDEGGGEVHAMGVMLLVFTPLPYVDATSAWALRSKWRRITIGAAGMLIEIPIAAIAAIVWTQTGEGTMVHALCYNMMFIASVSTVLFNGNPLLRYDAYYILSDLLEIPNLAPRSRQYLTYLIKRYVFGVRRANNPAHTRGEKAWFAFYGVASTIYRVMICAGIILMIANRFFFIGVLMAVGAVGLWLLMPLGKVIHYLATNNELMRVRPRAVGSVLAFAAIVLAAVGWIKAPDRIRVEGIVEPVDVLLVAAPRIGGFLVDFEPDNTLVKPGQVLLECENNTLAAELESLQAEQRQLEIQRRYALAQEPFAATIFARKLAVGESKIQEINRLLAELTPRAETAGTWLAVDIESKRGAYLDPAGRENVGMVVSLDSLLIRAIAGQKVGARLHGTEGDEVDIRIRGRPDDRFSGTIMRISDAGQQRLPSASLGYSVGGQTAVSPDDPQGTKAAERFFEIRITPHTPENICLLTGQRVIVRISLPAKPLAAQWWRAFRQLIQRRFQVL